MKQFIGEKLKTNKTFGILLIFISLFGIAGTLFQIIGYDQFIRPYLFELPVGIIEAYPNAKPLFPAFTSNNVSGFNSLGYFTVISNILTNLYIISLGLSIVGVKKAEKFGFNKYYAGAVTMFIAITGIVYTFVMLPFFDYNEIGWVYEFPGIAFFNVYTYWQHMVLPITMLILWYLPFSNEKLEKKKFVKLAVIFPIIYSFLTVLRGCWGGLYQFDANNTMKTWWPYPFLAVDRIEPYVAKLFPNPSYALVVTITVLAYIVVALIMFLTPYAIVKIHNKYIDNLSKKYTFIGK